MIFFHSPFADSRRAVVADSRRAVVSYKRKHVHQVLVNGLV